MTISPSPAQEAKFRISVVQSACDLDAVRAMLIIYSTSHDPLIAVPEVSNMPGEYGPPSGAFLIARSVPDCESLGIIACKHSQYLPPTACEMNRLYVSPAARGMGLGKALVLELLKTAREVGYAEMRLGVFEDNEAAVKLYEGCGFTKIDRYKPKLYEGIQAYSLSLVQQEDEA